MPFDLTFVGERTKNNLGVVIAERETVIGNKYILVLMDDKRYVSWLVDDERNEYHGRYAYTIHEAVNEFNSRT